MSASGWTASLTSPWDGRSRAPLRLVLAAVLAFDTVLVARFLCGLHPSAISHPRAPAWLLAFAGHPPLVVAVAVVALGALTIFTRRPAALAAGWVALGAVGLLVEAHAATIEGPYRMFFSGGAAMFGWLVAATFARAGGRDACVAEGHGDVGAAAGLAATYVNAFASKMSAGGPSWMDSDSLRAILLTQHPVDGSRLSDALAHLVGAHAGLAGALVTLTLVAQGSALVYPWHRAARAVSGALLLAFHANTAILTPLFFPQAMVLLAALSYPWPALIERVRGGGRAGAAAYVVDDEDDASSGASRRPSHLALIALLAAAIALAWTGPLRSYTLLHHRHGTGEADAPAPPPPADIVAALGDLRPGASLGAWELRDVSGKDAGARLDFASGDARLHVLVRPHGAIAGTPPASTRRFDVFYETAHQGEAPVAPDAAAALAQQVAAVAGAHE